MTWKDSMEIDVNHRRIIYRSDDRTEEVLLATICKVDGYFVVLSVNEKPMKVFLEISEIRKWAKQKRSWL